MNGEMVHLSEKCQKCEAYYTSHDSYEYDILVPREIDAKTRKKTQMNGVMLVNERDMTRTYVLYGESRGNSIRFARDIQAIAVIGHNIARSLKTLPSASDTSVSA